MAEVELDFSAFIAERTKDFAGRKWVFAEIDRWLADPNRNPVFLLTGEPGSGKSAIMARLAQIGLGEATIPGCRHLNTGFLAHFHFCQVRKDATLNPLRYVEDLSRRLANTYQPFRGELLALKEDKDINIQVQQSTGDIASGGQVAGVIIQSLHLGGLSARAAFDRTIRRPLEALCTSSFAGPIVLLVDSLDEALSWRDEENIASLLACAFGDPSNLPPQVHVILASRNDEQIEEWFGKASLDLIDDAPRRAKDVQGYVYDRLRGVDEGMRKRMARFLDRQAQGNFLYARHALKEILSTGDARNLAALSRLPTDLDGIYHRFIEAHLAASQKLWKQVRPLLGALVVARDSGLTRDQLHGIMDLFKELSPSETDDLLSACSQYLEGPKPVGPFQIYHQSFREFLEKGTDFSIYPAEAHQAIASFFLEVYGSDWLACEDSYALRHTLVHLLEAAAATIRPEDRLVHARIQKKITLLQQDEGYKVARMRKLSRGELTPAVEAFISHKALGFVGRQWVFRRLNDWLDSAQSRHFLIFGGPGTGKTALAARLWQISRGLVAIDELQFPQLTLGYLTYAHLAQATAPTSWAPLQFLEGLSRMLVVRYKDYARLYVDQVLQRLAPSEDQPTIDRALDLPKIQFDVSVKSLGHGARVLGTIIDRLIAGDPSGTVEIRQALDQFEVSQGIAVRELVARFRDVPQAVDTLLDPLRQMCGDNPHLRVVILLDGLEKVAHTPMLMESNLMSLMDRLPEQVRLVLLSRPLAWIVETLGPPQVDLDREAVAGENDILEYALGRLSSLPEHERRSAAEQVAHQSRGNFAVACAALDKVGPYD